MSNEKRPPIRYDGEVSKQELGQIRPPSRSEMQSRLLAANQTPKERQASADRVQQVMNRAMEYVQAQKRDAPGRLAQAPTSQAERPALANHARQRDNTREATRDKSQEQAQQKEKGHER